MKISKQLLSLLAFVALSACGQPLVEFDLADGGTTRDGGSAVDSGSGRSDGGRVDGGLVDAGGLLDGGFLDGGFGDGGLIDGGSLNAPTVVSTIPSPNLTGVSVDVSPSATFSMPMDTASITDLTFTLARGSTLVGATVSYAGTRAVLNPNMNLAPDTTYTATIAATVKSLAGTPMGAPYSWSFTTERNPTVIATKPENNAIDAGLNVSTIATFSTPMNPATLNDVTFTLTYVSDGGTAAVAAVVTAGNRTATVNPTQNLRPLTQYTATVSTGARSQTGLPLITNAVWVFTTGTSLDLPFVMTTCPRDGANGVLTTAKICAVFSKPMDPATIDLLSFSVSQGLLPVTGSVSYDVATATAYFTPMSPMGLNLTYTATLTTAVKDLSGNAMMMDKTWSWMTGACGQLPITLGSAEGFAVLAGSTITNTGPTLITGDVGVSPGTAITGFGPGAIVGATHAGDPTAAQGIADLTIAYNEAAGRTLCPVTVAGNLGGQTLAPGLYKSTSSLAVSSGDLTLDAEGDPSAVFIFQIASTLTTTSGRQVILAGGAQAKNVFWQVGTSATFGSTTAFVGTVMADQAITMQTGATIEGRVLARITAASFDSNTVVRPLP